MSIVIGISGVAGAGKDLFFSLLRRALSERGIEASRYALADELRNEIAPLLLDLYGVDINSCDRETKNFYRPLLVFHGKVRRSNTEGRYWIDKVSDKIKSENVSGVSCITDIRYDSYEKDEVYWLKNDMGGILIHISLFKMENGKKVTKIGANDDEKQLDPILKSKADYNIEWELADSSQCNNESKLLRHVDDFLFWLNKNDKYRLYLGGCSKENKLREQSSSSYPEALQSLL